ncbi:MAG TPA: hypothetical protein VM287_13630 [Egibacteraceae bacterium]|nr:hypothetical protein [Egibacteraceae bacterium]
MAERLREAGHQALHVIDVGMGTADDAPILRRRVVPLEALDQLRAQQQSADEPV